MTVTSESIEAAVRAFAEREHLTVADAAERLIGYGLDAVAENDRYLESLKPTPYRVAYCEAATDADGDTTLTDYVEVFALPTLEDAKKALCGIVEADADTKAAIEAAPLGHAVAIGGDYYRITKSS